MNIILILLTFNIIFSNCFKKLESDDIWEIYKSKYNYKFDSDENAKKKTIFLENFQKIEKHNKKVSSFKLGINSFTHLVFYFYNRHQMNFLAAQK